MKVDDWDPSIIDRLSGALLAFRTDLPRWNASGDCIYCGSVTFIRFVDGPEYKRRCFHCGATGYGGPVGDNDESPLRAKEDRS